MICIDARYAAVALQAGFCDKKRSRRCAGHPDLMRVNKHRPVGSRVNAFEPSLPRSVSPLAVPGIECVHLSQAYS
jgi:hypothetical protein